MRVYRLTISVIVMLTATLVSNGTLAVVHSQPTFTPNVGCEEVGAGSASGAQSSPSASSLDPQASPAPEAQADLLQLLGQIGGIPSDITVRGDRAYLAMGWSLVVLDISGPEPTNLATVYSGAEVQAVDLAGNVAYLAVGELGVRAVDVSDPSSPHWLGTYNTQGFAGDVVISGTTAYVSDASEGLRILDISDPENITETGFYDTPGSATAAAVSGTTVYVADGSSGLRIIDVTTPESPSELGTACASASAVAQSGSLVAVISERDVVIVDVVDPTSPSELATYAPEASHRFSDVAMSGTVAFAAGSVGSPWTDMEELSILDVSDPGDPTRIGGWYGWDEYCCGSATNLTLEGDAVWLLNPTGFVTAVDVSVLSAPIELQKWRVPADAEDIAVSGTVAYLGCENTGLHTTDVSDPSRPLLLGNSDAPDGHDVRALYLKGDLAYAAAGWDGLDIHDVSDPASPSWVGSLDSDKWAGGVFVTDTVAYLTVEEGLQIIDVSQSDAPYQIGFFPTDEDSEDVVVVGTVAYVANGYAGLRVIDVSDSAVPTETVALDTPGFARRLALEGNTLYVADGSSGVRIIDVSTSDSPSEIGFCDTAGQARDVAVSGSLLYVADGSAGVGVFDLSDPADPVEIAHHDAPGDARAIAVCGSAVYVVDGSDGLFILWFVPPASGSIPTAGGSLVSSADQTTYIFPADTFTDTVVITHTIPYSGNVPSPAGNLTSIGHAFNVTGTYSSTGSAAQLVPGQTFTVTVQYTDTEIGSAYESSLGLYWWDGAAWSQQGITSSVNTTDNLLTSQVDHLSLFAVLGPETRRVFLPLILRDH